MKKYISTLAIASMLIFQGCGGGSGGGGSQITNISELDHIRISIAGSSITNGSNAYVSESSYVGKVEEYLRTQKATTLMPDDLTSTTAPVQFENEPMCYKGTLAKYSGKDTVISGTITGAEISLAYAKERGNKGASIIEFAVDGKVIDTFSTYDDAVSVHDGSKNFTGNGTNTYFDLGEAFTFDHTIRVNGNSTDGHINDEINDIDISPTFDGDDWMIIRKVSDSKVHHFILFRNPPANGATIQATFKYGESIKPGKSTIGNLTQNIGTGTESPYGEGGVPFDISKDENLASGLDFRQTDERAIKTWTFDDNGTKNFTFTIKSIDPKATGTPEFFVNFVTNRMHYVQNAGIGGFKASDFLETSGLTTTKQIIDFKPNVFVLESGTNDAGYNYNGFLNEDGTNNWLLKSAQITEFTLTSLTLNKTASILPGDILEIGSYSNDIDDIDVRIVKNWDASTKTATFDKELTAADYIGKICRVKRIDKWEANVRDVINRVKSGVGSPLFLAIGTSGVPNLSTRSLAGYREKGMLLSDKLGASFVDFYKETYDFNGGIDETNQPADIRWSYSDNTHPNEKGRELFGDAVNKALFE